MAIIINELEVVLEAPATLTQAAAPAPAQVSGHPIQPIDLMDITEKRARTEWRLMAH